MTTAPRGYTRKDVQTVRQRVATGVKAATNTLDGSTPETTTEDIRFGGAMSKVSFQVSGTLVATVSFSISGENWFTPTATVASTAGAVSYSAHNVEGVRVVWTSGTGQCFIAAV